MCHGQQIGYKRVSTIDQKTTRQLDGITLHKFFEDQVSGKSLDRPQLQAAIDFVREGDTFVVHSMDRLARNVDDLRKLVKTLNSKGVKVHFVKENLIFTGEQDKMANLLLSLLGAVAEFERDLIRERQREGIAIAKAKGGIFRGRVPSLTSDKAAALRARIAAGERKSKLASEFGISRASVYNYVNQT